MVALLTVPRQNVNVGGRSVQVSGFTVPDDLRAELRDYSPRGQLGRIARRAFAYLPPDLAGELLHAIQKSMVAESSLYGAVIDRLGRITPLGLLSEKVVADAGVAFVIDAFQNIVELEIMKYHAIGTGVTAEAASQAALITELTTEYNPNSTRATGSTVEAAANIYQTVGTNLVDGAVSITEHMVMSQAATGGGVGFDRSLFTAVALGIGDSLQTDYRWTLNSGG